MTTEFCAEPATSQSAIEAARQAIYAELLTAAGRVAASCLTLDQVQMAQMIAQVVAAARAGDYRAIGSCHER